MSIEDKLTTPSKDFLADNAIQNGIKKVEEEKQEIQNLDIELRYTNSELEKIRKLTAILRLGKELFLESVISYVHFLFSEHKESIQKIIDEESENYQAELKQITPIEKMSKKDRDRFSGKIRLSPETSDKIEQLNMKDRINECLFVGINLLYKQLVGEFKTVNQEK
jgi:Fe2+ transport system protein B